MCSIFLIYCYLIEYNLISKGVYLFKFERMLLFLYIVKKGVSSHFLRRKNAESNDIKGISFIRTCKFKLRLDVVMFLNMLSLKCLACVFLQKGGEV